MARINITIEVEWGEKRIELCQKYFRRQIKGKKINCYPFLKIKKKIIKLSSMKSVLLRQTYCDVDI